MTAFRATCDVSRGWIFVKILLENVVWAAALRWLLNNGLDPNWWTVSALMKSLPRPMDFDS